MTSSPSQNEGFRLLDELVCQAILAPTVQDVQAHSPVESRGENEGMRVCEPVCRDTVESSPTASSNAESVSVGGDDNDILLGGDVSDVVISDSASGDSDDVMVGGFGSDRRGDSEPGHASDLVDRAMDELLSVARRLKAIVAEWSFKSDDAVLKQLREDAPDLVDVDRALDQVALDFGTVRTYVKDIRKQLADSCKLLATQRDQLQDLTEELEKQRDEMRWVAARVESSRTQAFPNATVAGGSKTRPQPPDRGV